MEAAPVHIQGFLVTNINEQLTTKVEHEVIPNNLQQLLIFQCGK